MNFYSTLKLTLSLGLATAIPQAATPSETANNWSSSQSVSLTLSNDDNVFLQDVTDQASKGSTVTSLTLKAATSYKGSDDFGFSAAYSGTHNAYDSQPSEDHWTHVFNLNAKGKARSSPWSNKSKLVLIDGSSVGPTFTGPGGATAAGGIPIRNRRDAVIYVGSGKIEQTFGDTFFRPLYNIYTHDFGTEHRADPGYLNYVDRNNLSGGFDIGTRRLEDHTVYLGFRYGHQKQETLLGDPRQYSNYYQQLLIGVKGEPKGWLNYSVVAGPDKRDFSNDVTAGFDPSPTLLHYNASLSFLPSEKDSINVSAKQYVQPSYGGRSFYQDITYNIDWKRKGESFSSKVGFKAYNTDWFAPFSRNDWIYTASSVLSWQYGDQWTAEASYVYDWSESRVPNTSGREFTRSIASIGIRYSFK